MPIDKRRSRIVSFRLSKEEYDALKNVSATRGARSVSEFTRSVACTENHNGEGKIEDLLTTLNVRMELLDRRVQMLWEDIKNAKDSTDSTDSKGK